MLEQLKSHRVRALEGLGSDKVITQKDEHGEISAGAGWRPFRLLIPIRLLMAPVSA